MDAVKQAQQQIGKIASVPLGLGFNLPSMDSRTVATMPNGTILRANGQVQPSPATRNLLQLQQNPVTLMGGPDLIHHLAMAIAGGRGFLPQAVQQQQNPLQHPDFTQGLGGQNFAPTNVLPDAVQQTITNNANITDNKLYPLFKEQLPQDPTASMFQRILQNNAQARYAMDQNPFAQYDHPVDQSNQFAGFDKQTMNPLVRQIIAQYQNFQVQTPQNNIPAIGLYGGVNAFNNRIH